VATDTKMLRSRTVPSLVEVPRTVPVAWRSGKDPSRRDGVGGLDAGFGLRTGACGLAGPREGRHAVVVQGTVAEGASGGILVDEDAPLAIGALPFPHRRGVLDVRHGRSAPVRGGAVPLPLSARPGPPFTQSATPRGVLQGAICSKSGNRGFRPKASAGAG